MCLGETQPDSLLSDSDRSSAASFVVSYCKDKSKGTQEGRRESVLQWFGIRIGLEGTVVF